MQNQKKQKVQLPHFSQVKKKQNYSFFSQLPTLFTIQGNPNTFIEVIGSGELNTPKYVRKTILLDKNNLQYAYNERAFMKIINSDYVVKLLHWEQITQKVMTKAKIIDKIQKIPKKLVLYMQYCDKGNLRDYLTQQNPSMAKRISIFIDVLYAMRFLHQKHIIHRDMKLENIFVTAKDQIRIADLGYAAQTSTVAQTRVGTFAYQAPEVFLQLGDYNDKADVWSIGYLGFQILNKPMLEEEALRKMIRDPFMPVDALKRKVMQNADVSLEQLMFKVFQTPLMFVPQIPNSLKYLLRDMLVPFPEKRLSFQKIYEGRYFEKLILELNQNQTLKIQNKNLHNLISEYPKLYCQIQIKRYKMQKNERVYKLMYQKLYLSLIEIIFPGDLLKPIAKQKNNQLSILLFLTMRKLKMIYQEAKREEFLILKREIQKFDNEISEKYLHIKNSVEGYLRIKGQKPIEQNKRILEQKYFRKLIQENSSQLNINPDEMSF